MSINSHYAKGRMKAGVMNKTEADYASLLKLRKHANEITWYAFEAMTFKLAPDTRYTPDFIVLTREGYLEAHEVKVKAIFRDDAKAKIKIAASMFPIKFVIAYAQPKKAGGGFQIESV